MQRPRMIPPFRLPNARGDLHGSADHLQRRDMVVAVAHAACETCACVLDALTKGEGEFTMREAARVTVLSEEGIAREGALFDGRGSVRALLEERVGFPAGEAYLLIADRYGEVHKALPIHVDEPEELVRAALGWIDFVQTRCEECNAPEW